MRKPRAERPAVSLAMGGRRSAGPGQSAARGGGRFPRGADRVDDDRGEVGAMSRLLQATSLTSSSRLRAAAPRPRRPAPAPRRWSGRTATRRADDGRPATTATSDEVTRHSGPACRVWGARACSASIWMPRRSPATRSPAANVGLHRGDRELDLVVGEGAAHVAAGHDLEHALRRVDHDQDAARGRGQRGVQAGGELARLALGVADEDRELHPRRAARPCGSSRRGRPGRALRRGHHRPLAPPESGSADVRRPGQLGRARARAAEPLVLDGGLRRARSARRGPATGCRPPARWRGTAAAGPRRGAARPGPC